MPEETPKGAVSDLIARIRDKDPNVRAEARDNAGKAGAAAVEPLAQVMKDDDFEIARAARRALWKIVRYAGRPGADGERKNVVAKLIPLLRDGQPVPVRREIMWMLSEIAGDEAVAPAAAHLSDKELREDARMVLERLPGSKSLAALKRALDTVPQEFKINIAQSLRARGVKVAGFPCQKLVPTRKTDVKAAG
jgi:HEAT repeat protein